MSLGMFSNYLIMFSVQDLQQFIFMTIIILHTYDIPGYVKRVKYKDIRTSYIYNIEN